MAGKLGALASDSEDRPASKLRWSTSASDLVAQPSWVELGRQAFGKLAAQS